jgi:hypothetical protein
MVCIIATNDALRERRQATERAHPASRWIRDPFFPAASLDRSGDQRSCVVHCSRGQSSILQTNKRHSHRRRNTDSTVKSNIEQGQDLAVSMS